ncbi:hypothetical protein CHLNCDRAFT_135693 [Chlorella variabilis]|uniref:Mis18 domain-containing protein n=1 Tax=Chlorella variabilis TaxID=554065 RepID=E1ZIS9_CHLVA|nr:hypothetical protein CHLNCDRAFT_135693 [Chlorella variabilis]EFN54211.1 hypothetical protein CHLNCDRAFT_135693 [Chlorella variabilis]|eukprot:XP_005846313.1 hypothetical protein CHLNCDRAFT_135693 [Chlorella variabilis]
MSITSTSLHTSGALVFQCAACKTILSDSREFVCTLTAPGPAAANYVAVKGVCDARVDRIAHTAEHTTHFSLCCAGCGGAVGRLYTEVPPALAPVCNLFCLEVSSCLSYELGSAEVRAPGGGCAPAVAQQQQQQQVGGPQLPGAGGDATLVLELLARVEHLEASLCTLQGMQVLHDAQLRTLPGYQVDGQFAEAVAAGGS